MPVGAPKTNEPKVFIYVKTINDDRVYIVDEKLFKKEQRDGKEPKKIRLSDEEAQEILAARQAGVPEPVVDTEPEMMDLSEGPIEEDEFKFADEVEEVKEAPKKRPGKRPVNKRTNSLRGTKAKA